MLINVLFLSPLSIPQAPPSTYIRLSFLASYHRLALPDTCYFWEKQVSMSEGHYDKNVEIWHLNWKCSSLSHVRLFVTRGLEPGSSVRVIFQARILEWVAIPFSNYAIWGHQENNTKIYNNDGYEIESYNLKHYKAWSKRK